MSVIIIPRKHLTQPQGRVTLADEFSNATMAFCGTGLDVARARTLPLTSSAGPLGQYAQNNSVAIPMGDASDWLPVGAEVTILFGGETNPQSIFPLFSTDSTGTNCANVYVSYSADQNVYWRWGGETNGVSSLNVGGLSFAASDLWAFTAGPRGMEIWQNGRRVAHQVGSSSRSSTPTTLRYGQFSPAGGVASIRAALLAAVPRQLDADFLSSRQYFSVFRADPIRIYSLPSGPISVSWSSLTASNMTPTSATLTLGGIVR